ncbi:14211_t:CDS:2, partial [Gigaspora margarita]
KETNSNSLFQLLYKLKKKEDNSYDIEKAQKEFKKITSPNFVYLTKYFQEIVKNNNSSLIYYRYNNNCNITNYLSLEPFGLSETNILVESSLTSKYLTRSENTKYDQFLKNLLKDDNAYHKAPESNEILLQRLKN